MVKHPKILVEPPGPKARELLERDKAVISPSYVRWYPLVVESGRGCIIRDVDGNEYIDFNAGIAVVSVGHCHPKVVEAVKKQAEKLIHYSNTDFYYEESVKLAEELVKITPGEEGKKVFFCNSGAEAIEAAVKLARWHTKRQYIIAFIGAFHGRTYGALSLTASKPVQRRGFSPLLPCVVHVPFPYCYRCPFNMKYPECGFYCITFIEEWVFGRFLDPNEVAAIVFEPILGEGGYIPAPHGFFQQLEKMAKKYGILLVDDEVQTGVGRTGKWWAIEHWNVTPDIMCIAKGIASGFPLGATVAKADIMDWPPGAHASTFGGNPVSCAAALAVIDVIKREGLLNNAKRQGEFILRWLRDLKEEVPIIGDVRGKGLMIGVEIVKDKGSKRPGVEEAKRVMLNCWKRGLAVIMAGVSTLRISPPLTITRELVETGMEILSEELRKEGKMKKREV